MNKRSRWLSIAGAILVLTYATGLSPDADRDPAVASATLPPTNPRTVQQQGTVAVIPTIVPTAMTDEISTTLSPGGQWLAVVNRTAGSLKVQAAPDGPATLVFPPGNAIGDVSWSPDSRHLMVVRTISAPPEPKRSGIEISARAEIWSVEITDDGPQPVARVFQSTPINIVEDFSEQIVLGDWAPDSCHTLFWIGPVSASILADGLTPYVLNLATREATQVAGRALLNPRYHSWAPDGSALAITAGEYRSAQINKWLVVYDTVRAQATIAISRSEQIPGIVAWSPRGDVIAYAAVPAVQTNDQLADLMTWDNPAIAGRRIYLLDPDTGKRGRLNATESFQDAPVWSLDGLTLYYVERQGNELAVMAADPTTGEAMPVDGAREPLPELVGYYGQSDLDELLAGRSDRKRTP